MDNSIPAVERTIELLGLLEASGDGLDSAQLLKRSGIPRTTLFRILRILTRSRYVQTVVRDGKSAYVLGPALGRLAARVPIADDLALLAKPILFTLSEHIGETVKVVVRDGLESVALAVQHSGHDSRVTSRLGGRHPLNIGAGQRLLLAHAPQSVVDRFLAGTLGKRGSGSVIRAAALREDIRALRTKEWASGANEGTEGVGTIAALVHEPHHEVRAALVALYILGGRTERDFVRMRNAVIAAARELTAVAQMAG
jgi:DNA-binding IclR family transcriptional regulator